MFHNWNVWDHINLNLFRKGNIQCFSVARSANEGNNYNNNLIIYIALFTFNDQ